MGRGGRGGRTAPRGRGGKAATSKGGKKSAPAKGARSGKMPNTYEGRFFVGKFLKNDFIELSNQAYTHAIVLDFDPDSQKVLQNARRDLLEKDAHLPVSTDTKTLAPVDPYMTVFHFSTRAPFGSAESEMEAKVLFDSANKCLESALSGGTLKLDFGPPGLRLDRISNQDIRTIATPSNVFLAFMDPFLTGYLNKYHSNSMFPSSCKSEEILTYDNSSLGCSQLYTCPTVPLLPTRKMTREAEGTLLTWLKNAARQTPLGTLGFSGIRLIAKEKKATMKADVHISKQEVTSDNLILGPQK